MTTPEPLAPRPTESDVDRARAAGSPVRVYPDGWAHALTVLAESGAAGRRSHSGIEIIGGESRTEANRDLYPREWRGCNNEPGVIDAMLLDPAGAAIATEYRDNLRPAVPRLEPPEDATPEEVADLEFVELALWRSMPGGGWRAFWEESIEGVIRGLSLFERTFPFDTASGSNLVRLDPILAWSIDDWISDASGWGIRQAPSQSDERDRNSAARGATIESKRLFAVRYGWQNRGGNPEPYGIMRAGYRPWKSRRLLHLLLMNGSERAAYGIPYVEIDPDVAQKGDLDTVSNMMRNWRASLRGFGTFPPGYKPGVLTVPFDAGKVSALYDRMAVEWFQACGVPHLRIGDGAGAFNLHESMGSAFGRRLQGISAMLAESIEREIVRPLVLLRRDGATRFPRVSPGETLVGSPIDLVSTTIAASSAGVVSDRDGEIEARVRSLLLLPDMPAAEDDEIAEGPAGSDDVQKTAFNGAQIASAVDIVDRVATGKLTPEAARGLLLAFFPLDAEAVDAILTDIESRAPEPPPAPSGGPTPSEDVDEDDDEPAGAEDGEADDDPSEETEDDAPEALSDRFAGRVDAFGRLLAGPGGRPLRPVEEIVRLDETRTRTDAAANEVAAIVGEWRMTVAPKYAAQLAKAGSFEAMLPVPVPMQANLTRDLTATLTKVYKAGLESVESEAERLERRPELRAKMERADLDRGKSGDLGAPDKLSECGHAHALAAKAPRPSRGLPADPIDKVDPEAAIRSTVATTVRAEADKLRTASLAALQSAGRGGMPPDTPEQAAHVVETTVRQLSLPLARVQGQQDSNTIFGLARQQAQRAQGSSRFLYSNLIESDTCSPCADLDGSTFGIEQLADFATPYVGCEGGDRCACLILALD